MPQGVDQRQRRLAFGEVVADVFAHRVGIRHVVQHVIGNLEGHAKRHAVVGERVLDRLGCIGQDRADTARRSEQHRGLALDHAQVGGLVGVRVANVHQLQHFALGDLVRRVGHDLHDAHALKFHHQLESARVQIIADQHAGRIAEDRVRGFAATAQVGFVDDIVMQQGRSVDEFDYRRGLVMQHAAIPCRFRGQQHQHRPQALAAAGDDVFGDLIHQHHVGTEATADQPVYFGHARLGVGARRLEIRGWRSRFKRGNGGHGQLAGSETGEL